MVWKEEEMKVTGDSYLWNSTVIQTFNMLLGLTLAGN